MPLPTVNQFNGSSTTERQFKEALAMLLEYISTLSVDNEIKNLLSNKVNSGAFSQALILKADKQFVVDALAAFQNGATKVYLTLAEANTDIANIDLNTKVSVLNATDGGDYYKPAEDSTFLSKSPYDVLELIKKDTGEKIADVKVETIKDVTDNLFKKTENNLFNPFTVIKGLYRGNDDFELNDTYWTSDFIPVVPGLKYKRSNIDFSFFVFAFDEDKQQVIVTQGNTYWQSEFENTTIPANVAYVRLVVSPLTYNQTTFCLKSILPMNGQLLRVESLMISEKESLQDFVDNTKSLVSFSNNLLDIESLVDWTNSNIYSMSELIPVEAGKKYKRTNMDFSWWVEAFDINKQPVVVNGSDTYWQYAFENTVIPEGVAYVRLLFLKAELNTMAMFTEATIDTSAFIPFRILNPSLMVGGNTTNATLNTSTVQSHSEVDDLGFVDNQLFDTDYSHLIFYGQSLSMGWEADRALTLTPVPKTYMIGDRVWINQGNDGSYAFNPLVASKSPNCGESPAVSATQVFRTFLDKYLPTNTVKLLTTNCGEGGMSIERLSKESTNADNLYTNLFLATLNRAKSITVTEGKTISCPAIVWMQGEYNYVGLENSGLTPGSMATNDKDQIKSYLLTLKNNMQADIMVTYGQTKKPMFFMYQVAGVYINLDTLAINEAMTEFEAENDDVVFMNPTYQVPDYNGGHLSSNGYRWYGEYIAKQLKTTLLEHKSSDVVQKRNVKVIDNNKVLIECQVNHPPLMVDTYTTPACQHNGFKVKDDMGEIAVTGFEVVNGTALLLTLARELGPNAFVTYAGKDRNGSGNICDSHRYASKFVYVSDIGHMAPSYTPKDSTGVPLDGKKLPLKNWLLAFYQKLN